MVELVEKGLAEAGVKLASAKVAVLGLAFLRDSDNTRNSPALIIIDLLYGRVKDLVVHDTMVEKSYKATLIRDIDSALAGADCAVIVTDHSVYKSLDWGRARRLMRTPLLVDGRNVLDSTEARLFGFKYIGIGKGK